eukprot:1191688-Prorocentrum_minimum.AAC.1
MGTWGSARGTLRPSIVSLLSHLFKFPDGQAVDAMTLDTVEHLTKPAVFAIAAKYGTVRLIDNMEMAP